MPVGIPGNIFIRVCDGIQGGILQGFLEEIAMRILEGISLGIIEGFFLGALEELLKNSWISFLDMRVFFVGKIFEQILHRILKRIFKKISGLFPWEISIVKFQRQSLKKLVEDFQNNLRNSWSNPGRALQYFIEECLNEFLIKSVV